MESRQSSDSRWQQVIAARAELEKSIVTLPQLVDRDSRPRAASPRTVRFAQALAIEVAWTGISDARERRIARAIH